MKPATRWALLWILAGMTPAYAQVYKWTGPDGTVHYGDTPPPVSTAKNMPQAVQASPTSKSVSLPYELAEAVKKHPVTLYSSANCTPCETGRSLLMTRGVPFTEKTVRTSDDVAHVREVSGDSQLPVLMVGTRKQQGFVAEEWNATLTAAGYPTSNKLPKGYRNPPPEAAAPIPKKDPVAAQPASSDPAPATLSPAPAGNTAPDSRFRF